MASGWRQSAKCEGMDTDYAVDFFFPNANQLEKIRTAKAFCLGCSVREECLRDAIYYGDDGIRGGATKDERVLMSAFLIVADLNSANESSPRALLDSYMHSEEQTIHITLDIHTSIPDEHQYESIRLVVLNLIVPQEYRNPHPSQSEDSLAECG